MEANEFQDAYDRRLRQLSHHNASDVHTYISANNGSDTVRATCDQSREELLTRICNLNDERRQIVFELDAIHSHYKHEVHRLRQELHKKQRLYSNLRSERSTLQQAINELMSAPLRCSTEQLDLLENATSLTGRCLEDLLLDVQTAAGELATADAELTSMRNVLQCNIIHQHHLEDGLTCVLSKLDESIAAYNELESKQDLVFERFQDALSAVGVDASKIVSKLQRQLDRALKQTALRRKKAKIVEAEVASAAERFQRTVDQAEGQSADTFQLLEELEVKVGSIQDFDHKIEDFFSKVLNIFKETLSASCRSQDIRERVIKGLEVPVGAMFDTLEAEIDSALAHVPILTEEAMFLKRLLFLTTSRLMLIQQETHLQNLELDIEDKRRQLIESVDSLTKLRISLKNLNLEKSKESTRLQRILSQSGPKDTSPVPASDASSRLRCAHGALNGLRAASAQIAIEAHEHTRKEIQSLQLKDLNSQIEQVEAELKWLEDAEESADQEVSLEELRFAFITGKLAQLSSPSNVAIDQGQVASQTDIRLSPLRDELQVLNKVLTEVSLRQAEIFSKQQEHVTRLQADITQNAFDIDDARQLERQQRDACRRHSLHVENLQRLCRAEEARVAWLNDMLQKDLLEAQEMESRLIRDHERDIKRLRSRFQRSYSRIWSVLSDDSLSISRT